MRTFTSKSDIPVQQVSSSSSEWELKSAGSFAAPFRLLRFTGEMASRRSAATKRCD